MNQIPNARFGPPASVGVKPDARLQAAFLSHAFTWMFVGLLVSAAVAFGVHNDVALQRFAFDNYLLLIIATLALTFVISGAINRLNATVALGLFIVFAGVMGLTIGAITSQFRDASVATAFVSAASIFGAAALYGAVTKRSLAGIGGYLTMGIIGLFVALLVNAFIGSSLVGYLISVVGVVLFTVLTAYDVQRIQSGAFAAWTGSLEKAAVIGALHLYLDFINLFLFLLRLFGGGRN
jgi:uncharacterized protein